MFQAARQGGLTSLARCDRVHDELIAGCGKGWGDLPGLNRRLRAHNPRCCRYIKITIVGVGRGAWD
jgi:hypothetical protein